jgi:putative component of membrane protein insertase Oxa1/YidC/SpoIIIJ protein YidD
VLLAIIRVYRFARPYLPRRTCLFDESCSMHVERVTRSEGIRAGLRALLGRVRTCRPGYGLATERQLRLPHRFANCDWPRRSIPSDPFPLGPTRP